MFARYFVELPLPAEAVRLSLTRGSGPWAVGPATDANHRADQMLAEVGFGTAVPVARTVAVELGAPVDGSSKTVIPMRWTALGNSGIFPSLEADLEIASLGSENTQLAISARYTPPLGVIGRAIDRAVLHRVAEATIKNFLDRVRDSVMNDAADTSPSEPVAPTA